jgi:oxygen-independent coproporphyrinogen-3 oxidase
MKSLYIHIPFCKNKCFYCDFTSVVNTDEKIREYIGYLIKEMKMYKVDNKRHKIKTIFIGGGTPSLLGASVFKLLVDNLRENFDLSGLIEFTIEANPESVTWEKLNVYRECGVNRLSMGLQTTDDSLLKRIGRIHSLEEFRSAFDSARKAGFTNINLDLMFGLPGQTVEDVKKTLGVVKEINPEHISAYGLKLEDGTKLSDMFEKGLLDMPSEEEERDMCHIINEFLEENGYHQYEVSNYAKDGMECKHNIVYWEGGDYIALGMASHGYLDDVRYENSAEFKEYYKYIEEDKLPIVHKEEISEEEKLKEAIILGLRLNKGIDIEEININHGISFLEDYKDVLKDLKNRGLIDVTSKNVKLTKLGFDLCNQVLVEFM